MDFSIPEGANPLDNERLVGKPLDRVEGPLKVQGEASYAYEIHEGGEAAYGFLLTAGSGKATIRSIESKAAEAAPGVLLVMTHENAPKQAERSDKTMPQLQRAVLHNGESVALVVAETFEQARAASFLIKVDYNEEAGAYDFEQAIPTAHKPPDGMFKADVTKGDFAKAFAAAPVQVDVTYTTPEQSQQMMEPHATLAFWDEDRLVLYTANQMLNAAQKTVAATLLMPVEKVRVVSHYIGGGFGSKLKVFGDAILAALASRQLKRPVKIALTRQQIFNHTTHRTATVQRMRLGADETGKLQAIGHESVVSNLPGKDFFEPVGLATIALYEGANRLITHRSVNLDIPESASMRAPGEAVGMLGLEGAMDELAAKLGLDPIELRVRNEPSVNPQEGTPFSSRKLVDCMREGARLFGWNKRNQKPGQMRDGNFLVGMGMAAAARNNLLQPSRATAVLMQDGALSVKTAMTDIGTGSYTIFTQIAGEMLGLSPDKITMNLGDTNFPEASGSGGSWGASSAGSSVYYACDALRTKLAEAAGLDPTKAVFEDGFIRVGNVSRALAELAGTEGISADGEIKPGKLEDEFTQIGFGANFAEVAVDIDTGEIRLRRMLGVFAAGRILNAKTARSQAIGGMVFGVGAALTEEAVIDKRYGYFVNHDLAEYHVPVHADISDIEAIYLPELDNKANPLKSKGVGELGISGAGAAIANAVYNACGARIRDYPLTLDKVLAALPE